MNPIDKKTLIGIAVVSSAGYLYLSDREKKLKPVRFLGLDPGNSKKLFAAISVLSLVLLATNSAKLKKVIA